MKLDKLYIKGFRNFKEAIIHFNDDSLIIGANDVGKTNLIYALRILLDRGFSDYDLELKESDYHAYEENRKIVIRAYFSDVKDSCIVARMPGKISDEGNLVIQYEGSWDNVQTVYSFSVGKSDKPEDLMEVEGPTYRKWLNIKYIGSRRELWSYISKTKKILLTQCKENRTEDTRVEDDRLYDKIKGLLKDVDESIPSLSYVKNATNSINEELNKLSIHHKEQQVVFDTATSNVDDFIDNVSITSRHGEKKLLIGGDGRANQIFLSLWATQNQNKMTCPNEISIICIEEPEAYLHPHQQRELASYLTNCFNGQVIITTHSPFIASEFNPNSIIRIYKDENFISQVASDGCSEIIGKSFEDFGYRMSVIPAEAFFSDCVILIEGPSEEVFYKTLAKQLDINLDRLNISILDVGGVGFKTYIDILNALGIHWVMRTDNDYSKVPDNTKGKSKSIEYRFAGIMRGLSLLNRELCTEEERVYLKNNESKVNGISSVLRCDVNAETQVIARKIIDILEKYDILIADEGLEEDLYNSPIKKDLENFYKKPKQDTITKKEVIRKMKDHKAINMYQFLKQRKDCLERLKDDKLALPLEKAKFFIESRYGTY